MECQEIAETIPYRRKGSKNKDPSVAEHLRERFLPQRGFSYSSPGADTLILRPKDRRWLSQEKYDEMLPTIKALLAEGQVRRIITRQISVKVEDTTGGISKHKTLKTTLYALVFKS